MGQQDILNELAGHVNIGENIRIQFDLSDPEQFEQAYRIAMSMPSCYQVEPYYMPTYHQLALAHQAKNPRQMNDALSKLCIDILYR